MAQAEFVLNVEVVDETKELETKALTWKEKAVALKVTDQATLDQAAELLKAIKGLRDEAEQHHRPVIAAAHQTHVAACAALKRIDAPLEEAERILRFYISGFMEEQERKRIAEQRRLEEERRRAAEEEIERQAQIAEAEGASKAEVEAIIQQPLMVAPVVVRPTMSKPQGISSRENWSARVTDKQKFLKAVAATPMWENLVDVNQSALNALARSLKKSLNIPGVEVSSGTGVSVRR